MQPVDWDCEPQPHPMWPALAALGGLLVAASIANLLFDGSALLSLAGLVLGAWELDLSMRLY